MSDAVIIGIVIIAVVLIAPGIPAQAFDERLGIVEGSAFPNIVLPRLNEGSPASLADFRGKRVVLVNFASW